MEYVYHWFFATLLLVTAFFFAYQGLTLALDGDVNAFLWGAGVFALRARAMEHGKYLGWED